MCTKYRGKIKNIFIIFVLLLFGCENNRPVTTSVPAERVTPYVYLKISPMYVNDGNMQISFSYRSKLEGSGSHTASGILRIYNESKNCYAKQISITLDNTENFYTTSISPNSFETDCKDKNAVYHAWIDFTYGTYNGSSENIYFVYGNDGWNCYGSDRSINFEYDFMYNSVTPIRYDFLNLKPTPTNPKYQEFKDLFKNTTNGGCHCVFTFDYSTSTNIHNGVYNELYGGNDEATLLTNLKQYCTNNKDHEENNYDYIVSSEKLTSPPPQYNAIIGLTPTISTFFPNYRPCFVFTGSIRSAAYIDTSRAFMYTAAHEIGHNRHIPESDPNYSTNCVMYQTMYTSGSLNYCEYHRCAIYNNSFILNKDNKTNIITYINHEK